MTRPARKRLPETRLKVATPPEIERGGQLERVIFKPRHKPITLAALHRALDPVIGAWLTATCAWEDVAVGDHRFVSFSTDVARETQVYVQFWSEPLEPVLWEVSSGKWNPPADKWLAGERSERIEALGFVIGGEAENFQREVRIESGDDIARIAREVVDVFYAAFDYRGTTAIKATLVYEGRSELRPTFDAFTPEEIAKVFGGCGYRVEEAEVGNDDDPPMLRCRKRGVSTIVTFGEPVPDEDLYGSALLSCELQVQPEDLAHLPEVRADAGETAPVVAASTFEFRGNSPAEFSSANSPVSAVHLLCHCAPTAQEHHDERIGIWMTGRSGSGMVR